MAKEMKLEDVDNGAVFEWCGSLYYKVRNLTASTTLVVGSPYGTLAVEYISRFSTVSIPGMKG